MLSIRGEPIRLTTTGRSYACGLLILLALALPAARADVVQPLGMGILSTADGSIAVSGPSNLPAAVEIRYTITGDGDRIAYRYEIATPADASAADAVEQFILQVAPNFGPAHALVGTTPFAQLRSAVMDDHQAKWEQTGTAGIQWTLSAQPDSPTLTVVTVVTVVTDRRPMRGAFHAATRAGNTMRPAGDFWVPGTEPIQAADNMRFGGSSAGNPIAGPQSIWSLAGGVGGGAAGGSGHGEFPWEPYRPLKTTLPIMFPGGQPLRIPPTPITSLTPAPWIPPLDPPAIDTPDTPDAPIPAVPLPSAVWAGLALLALLSLHRHARHPRP